jgi:single-strand DNA-binding protein
MRFGKPAEHVEKYYKQGMKMVLTGRIQTGSYTNKDGVKVYTTDVVAEEIEFAESKSNGGDSNNTGKSKVNPNEKLNDVDDSVDSELPFN